MRNASKPMRDTVDERDDDGSASVLGGGSIPGGQGEGGISVEQESLESVF
jgi:hypothetical protein